MSSLSLSSRLALIIVGCSLAAIIAVMTTAYRALNEDFEMILTEQQSYEARSVSEKVSQNLQLRLDLLTAFSTTLTDGDRLLPLEDIQALIARQDRLNSLFSNGLLVLNAQATAIAQDIFVPNRIGTNYADRAHFAEALKTRKPVISRPIMGRTTGVPILSFVAPIQSDDGDLLGFLTGSINLNDTDLIPAEAQKMSKRQRAQLLVIDTDNFLYVERPGSEGQISPLPPPGEDVLIDAAMTGIGIGEIVTHQGERLIYATSHLQRLGWMFIRAVPQELARAPARKSFAQFSIFSLLVILIVTPIGLVVTRSAMTPLDRMTRKVKKMSGDNAMVGKLDEKGPPEVRNLAIAFNRLLEEREQASRSKDEFLANVSHELRTPLTSMNGALRLITSGTTGPLPEKAAKMSELALRNGERLQLLISDLLDFNKLAAGELNLDLREQFLSSIVTNAVQSNASMASEYHVRLTARCPEHLTMQCDAHRLRQILDNFISNAIKFSPSGGEVRLSVEPADHERIRITVSDEGKGVPDEFQPRLFERFAQAETGTSRAAKGTGLGLAICRELTLLMGGTIGAYNDRGAHFWIELPARSH